MSSGSTCSECGKPIPADSPGGFCGQCLLGLGLQPLTADPNGKGPENELPARSGQPENSDKPGPASQVGDRPRPGPASGPAGEKAGDRVGRYRLVQEIGHGGCGVVYLAEQEEPVRRKVALKVIKLGMDTRQVVARFEAERQALALMDHPNIARVLDAGATDAGRPFFVMELVGGIKITDYCDQHRLSTRERLDLFIQVCRAIQHAHQKGIIHRDIKPSNVLVATRDGVPVPKVIDFGIAKATQGRLTDQTLFTAFEQFLGTPAYMSPEQAQLGALDVDTRSDIYSLGVLLYELLTGKTPFDANELAAAGLDAMRRTIQERQPVRPSTRLSTMVAGELTATAQRRQTEAPRLVHVIRGDLDWIVMKCLEKDRARRYETANGLARDLERHLGCEPVLARPPSKLYEFQKTVRRHKFGFAATAAIVILLTLGVTLTTREALRATRAERDQSKLREVAVQALAGEQKAAGDLRENLYASEMGQAFHALAAGDVKRVRELLEAQPRDLRGFEWRYLWGQARRREVSTLDLGSHSYGCAVSPDGRYVAAMAGTLSLWDLVSRQKIVVRPPERSDADDLAFDPHGTILAVAMIGSHCIRLWNLETRQLMAPVLAVESANAHGVAFSPDGRWLATAGGLRYGDGIPGDAKVWDTATWRVRFTLGGVRDWLTRVKFSPDGRWVAASGGGGFLKIWEAATGREVVELTGLRGIVFGLCFSPNGEIVAGADSQGMIRFWEAGSWKERLTWDGHDRMIHRIAFSPDGGKLASCSLDQTVKLWNVRDGNLLRTLRGHSQRVTSVSFLPDGSQLASSSLDGTLKLWSVPAGPERTIIKGHKALWGVRVEFSPDGKWLAMTTNVAGVRPLDFHTAIFDTTSRQPMAILPGHPFKFAPNGLLLTGVSDSTLALWRMSATGAVEQLRLPVPTDVTLDADAINQAAYAFSADSSLLAARCANGVVVIWPLNAPSPPQTIQRPRLWENTRLLFSAVGPTLILGANADGILECLDPHTLRRVGEMHAGPGANTEALALSLDGRMVATIGPNGAPQLWDLPSRRMLTGFRRAAGVLGPLAFAPDGKTLVGGDSDGNVHFWNVASANFIATLPAHTASCRSISFSPDGRWLATAEVGDAVKLWPVPSFDEIEGHSSGPEQR